MPRESRAEEKMRRMNGERRLRARFDASGRLRLTHGMMRPTGFDEEPAKRRIRSDESGLRVRKDSAQTRRAAGRHLLLVLFFSLPLFFRFFSEVNIYNVPKMMTEEEVKKLCIDAILSRASKQNPEIQKVKLLKDDKKGKASAKKHSRGVAFVNFMEHEHALVALRVLNNNPGTFGSERRPIVEFALEDLNKLRLQKFKLDSLKRKNVDSDGNRSSTHVEIEKKKLNKTKHQRSKNEASQMRADTILTKEKTELVEKGNNRETSKKEIVGRRKNRVSAIRKIFESAKSDQMKSVVKPNSVASSRTKQTQLKAEKKAHSGALRETFERRPNKESMEKSRKRKLRFVNGSKQKRKKSSKPEEVDKLDRLIEQYCSKFAGIKSSKPKHDAQTGGHKEVRRWFELA